MASRRLIKIDAGLGGGENFEVFFFQNPDKDGHDDDRAFLALFRGNQIAEVPAPRDTSITFNYSLYRFIADSLQKVVEIVLEEQRLGISA